MMALRRIAALLAILPFLVLPALAVNPDEVLKDPTLEARARQISTELRCLVCQNQSIDISDAELAKDLRIIVRERLAAGDSDGEVLDYVVARYGEFVLLKPRFSGQNAFLWAAPLLVILIGAAILAAKSKRRRASETPAELSSQEQLQLTEIMRKNDNG